VDVSKDPFSMLYIDNMRKIIEKDVQEDVIETCIHFINGEDDSFSSIRNLINNKKDPTEFVSKLNYKLLSLLKLENYLYEEIAYPENVINLHEFITYIIKVYQNSVLNFFCTAENDASNTIIINLVPKMDIARALVALCCIVDFFRTESLATPRMCAKQFCKLRKFSVTKPNIDIAVMLTDPFTGQYIGTCYKEEVGRFQNDLHAQKFSDRKIGQITKHIRCETWRLAEMINTGKIESLRKYRENYKQLVLKIGELAQNVEFPDMDDINLTLLEAKVTIAQKDSSYGKLIP
jgi:hypothetical protein